jgi:integrase
VKELAGIDASEGLHASDRLRAHDLRAGLATAMANAGENAFTIQGQLGHRNIKTTMRYVRQSVADVRAAVDRTAERRRAVNGTASREGVA